MSKPATARILLVDDVKHWQEQLGGLLRDHGYEVITAASKKEAMAHLKHGEQFDLTIIDIRLDEEDEKNRDGMELGFWLRENEHTFPVIVLTAYDMVAVIKEPEIARRITRPPYHFPIVEKRDILSGDYNDLFYQIERALPWSKRPIRCFVIMPFHKSFDDIYTEIRKTLESLGVDCMRADKDFQAGHIPTRIRKHLRHNSFVIADLTGQRPNVLYELGYAHALKRPTILLCQDYKDLPQDLRTFQTIAYDVTFTGIEELKDDLTSAIRATVDAPMTTLRPRRGVQVVPHTYAQFIPSTSIGQAAQDQIVNPVVQKLNLQEQSTHTLFSSALRIEENWLNIQKACAVIAEISEGDPSVYYHVGASDALRETCTLLLIHQNTEAPFNLKGRANTVTYDPSTFRSAKGAQQELTTRLQACIESYTRRMHETTENEEQAKALQAKKEELWASLDQAYKQVVSKIDAYVQQEWPADERTHRKEDIQKMKQLVGREAEAYLNAIGEAKTISDLDKLDQQLIEKPQQWYNSALEHIIE